MTAEHRLLLELRDIRAITFECLSAGCGARLSLSPDTVKLDKLIQCPSCLGIWLGNDPNAIDTRAGSAGPLIAALAALRRKPVPGVRILFEFDDPTAS